MKHIDLILLTGPSHSGKSTIAKGLGERVALLNSDHEVMTRIFELWPDEPTRGFRRHIGEPELWGHIRSEIDFDAAFRLFHRDWLGKKEFPPIVLAEGWIYHSRHWRSQVFRCLSEIPNLKFTCHLWLVETTPEEFHLRYHERESANPDLKGSKRYLTLTDEEARHHSRRQFDKFFDIFEPPTKLDRWFGHFVKVQDSSGAERQIETILA